MTTSVYRAGIVGCGRKASTIDDEDRCHINYGPRPHSHARAYQLTRNVQLVAAASATQASADRFCERWHVPRAYDDFEKMLEVEDLDVLSVVTQTPLHAEVVIAAARAGVKGILCEKAMATSLDEADRMIAACRGAGATLIVNHPRRWHATYRSAKQAIDDGIIGDVNSIVATCRGPLIHNGSHVFDLLRFFGGDAEWVSGHIPCYTGGDDSGRGYISFMNGAAGFVNLDAQLGLMLELHGTSGTIAIDPYVEGFFISSYRDPSTHADDGATRQWFKGGPCKERSITTTVPVQTESCQVAAIKELLASLEGSTMNVSTGEDGRAALELALAIYESSRLDGARVSLPLSERSLRVVSR